MFIENDIYRLLEVTEHFRFFDNFKSFTFACLGCQFSIPMKLNCFFKFILANIPFQYSHENFKECLRFSSVSKVYRNWNIGLKWVWYFTHQYWLLFSNSFLYSAVLTWECWYVNTDKNWADYWETVIPPIYWFFVTPPSHKNRIFQWTPIIFKFSILSLTSN